MRIVLCVLLTLAAVTGRAAVPAITVRGLTIDYSPFTLVASPGETIEIQVPSGYAVALEETAGAIRSASGWALQAPKAPGFYRAGVTGPGDTLQLNLFVTLPASAVQNGALNGYRIGPPPPGHGKYPALYRRPAGFIEVSEDMRDLQLSPHFTLRQFLCKQGDGYPKYLVLQERLLVLLEGLLAAVREAGYAANTFGVISGYRTPWYNRKIGNVPNSRHVYGDAMDLFVDTDNDGRMDDLNGDGIHDTRDVNLLAGIAREFMARPENAHLLGGVGTYRKNAQHGGFVHVDARGYRARW